MRQLTGILERMKDDHIKHAVLRSTKKELDFYRHLISFSSKENQDRWERIIADTMSISGKK